MIKSVDSDVRYAAQARQIQELLKENSELDYQLQLAQQNLPKVYKADDFVEDNSTFNFRLNESLKIQFSNVCKRQHLTVGIALKRYMTDCVIAGALK